MVKKEGIFAFILFLVVLSVFVYAVNPYGEDILETKKIPSRLGYHELRLITNSSEGYSVDANENGIIDVAESVLGGGAYWLPAVLGVYYMGNAGIGESNPLSKLHISAQQDANIRLQDTSYADNGTAAYIEFYNETDRIGAIGLPGDTEDYLVIATEKGKDIVLSPSGNVGIGTADPQRMLHIRGDRAALRIDRNDDSPTIYLARYPDNTSDWSDGNAESVWLMTAKGEIGSIVANRSFAIGYDVDGNIGGTYSPKLTINPNGNVGIGTASPGAKLEIAGTDNTDLLALPGGMKLTYREKVGSLYGFNILGSDLDNSFFLHTEEGGSHQVLYYGDGNEVTNIFGISAKSTDSPIYDWTARFVVNQNGNVGIGTTTPGLPLDIRGIPGTPATSGTVQTNGSLRLRTTTGNSQTLDMGLLNTAPYGAWLQAANSGNLASSSILAINPNGGNVGIGTTTPGTKLEVAGQVKITGGTPGAGKVLTSDADGLASWITPSPSSVLTYQGAVIAETSTNEPSGLTFRGVYNNGYPTTFGNVLSLGGGGGGQLLIGWSGITGATADNYIRSRRDTGATWSSWAKILTDQNYVSYITSSQWTTSGTNIYNSNTGNVGIGTNSPQKPLHISATQDANIRLQDTDASNRNSSYVEFYAGSKRIGGMGVPGDTKDYLGIITEDGKDIILSPSGNVGIGTISPGAKLDVVGQINSDGINNQGSFVSNGYGSGDIWFPYTNGNSYLRSPINYVTNTIQDESGQWHIYTSGNADFLGNVGIGTIPGYKLDVAGDVRLTGNILYGDSDTRTYSRADIGLQGNAGAKSGFYQTSAPAPAANWYPGASSWQHFIDVRHSNPNNNYALQIAGSFFDQELYFRKTNGAPTTGWNKFVYQNSAGNVGIGTTNPGTNKLEVAGNIKSSGTICDGTGSCLGSSSSFLKVITLGDPREHSSYRSTCAILSDKTVKCWGRNGNGEIGMGQERSNRYFPETVPLPGGAVALAQAFHDIYALLENGHVWAWGYNGYGQLGAGSTIDFYIPVRVSGLTNVIKIVSSQGENAPSSACALKSDGTVWCWGYNGYGQVGDGSTAQRNSPVQVSGLTNVVDVNLVGGQYANSCALKSDGTVWCWGHNGYGQLGDGSTTSRSFPVRVSGLTNVINITSTDTGSVGHKCALKSDGTVWCWGHNGFGSVGDGTTTSPRKTPVQVSGLTNVKSITLGGGYYSSSIAILNDGTVRLWGYNGYGQLGDGTTIQRTTPINPGLSNVKQIIQAGTGSYTTTAALLNDGTVKCMGYNGHGQVGIGTNVNTYTPKTVMGLTNVETIWANGHSNGGYFCALLTDGRLKCWGYNGEGQLGNGNTYWSSIPTYVKNLNTA